MTVVSIYPSEFHSASTVISLCNVTHIILMHHFKVLNIF